MATAVTAKNTMMQATFFADTISHFHRLDVFIESSRVLMSITC